MRIKELRESKNMTQDELASLLSVSRSSVSMWETGQNYPLVEKLIQMTEMRTKIEANVPKGYVLSYVYKDGVVTVTNTESLIQTGQLSWPIHVMGALGAALIGYGIFVIAKKRKNEHA